MVEKDARSESPALLALMSTLYCCCSTRSRAMLFSFSTMRLPRWPHSTSRRASPGSTRTLASAASAPKSFFHSAALPAAPEAPPNHRRSMDMCHLQSDSLLYCIGCTPIHKAAGSRVAAFLLWAIYGLSFIRLLLEIQVCNHPLAGHCLIPPALRFQDYE